MKGKRQGVELRNSNTQQIFDPELGLFLSSVSNDLPRVKPETISTLRQAPYPGKLSDDELAASGVMIREVAIASFDDIVLDATIISPRGHSDVGPGIFHIHGGGMIMGDRMVGISQILPWVVEHDAVALTVEYRLAPEYPDPYPLEDCYAGLVWMAKNALEIGVDASRIIIAGASAGGGLAAGTALMARDRQGPELAAQVLICPMLDDRDVTVSTRQFSHQGIWLRESNLTGWDALLGERRGSDDVSIYAAPARAKDLTRLPPTFIDCGSAEVFRDEDVAYASALWQANVPTELHVWAGAFHGFDVIVPYASVSQTASNVRDAWVRRLLRNLLPVENRPGTVGPQGACENYGYDPDSEGRK